MILLFERDGSREIQLHGQSIPTPEWERLKKTTVHLLERRRDIKAADLLRKYVFIVHEGTNGFGDEFDLLYMQVPMAKYVEMAETIEDRQLKRQWCSVAEAVSEVVSKYIRFVAFDLDTTEEFEAVTSPVLEITSDVVERALRDAEQLLVTQGATSGVDRIHAAFHGYLLAVTARAGLTVSDNASVTELFKAIRQDHQSFQHTGLRQGDIGKVMRAFANIVDALNPVRNQASVAHPNEDLLEEPEAMLVKKYCQISSPLS